MNADRLLAQFEKISDAPDAVDRLRRFILDLAATGRLLSGEPSGWVTKPITECLEPLADGRVIHQGWSPQCKETPSGNDRVWGVLKTTAIQDGWFAPEHQKELPQQLDPKPLLEVRPLDILITCAGPRVRCGVPCLVEAVRPHLMISGKMYRFRTLADVVSPHFLLLVLRSKKIQALINAMKTGSSESGLNLTKERFSRLLISFGPLPEQHRIVAKVDELMQLCDRLEASQAERETRRDRLVVSSLNRLGNQSGSDPDEFKKDAGFHLRNLNRLSTKPQHIKEIRKAILNLAVRGKLVPQDDREEPFASDELADGAGSTGRRRKGNLDLYQSEDLCLPGSWKASPLGALVEPHRTISYGVLVPGPDAEGGVPFVRAQDLMLNSHPPRPNKTISPDVEKPYARTRLRGGEILLCVVGSIGKLGVVPQEWSGANIARAVARIAPRPSLNRDFLLLVLRESRVQEYFLKATRTLAQPTLNVGLIEKTLIPLPPLAEQKRIVAKVDELMAICDQLETQLESQQKESRRLLEALLHEALEGVG